MKIKNFLKEGLDSIIALILGFAVVINVLQELNYDVWAPFKRAIGAVLALIFVIGIIIFILSASGIIIGLVLKGIV